MSDNNTNRGLHVLVFSPTRELCRVVMPLASVNNLEHLFPDDDLGRVKSAGVDFRAVIARANATNFAPQTLIETTASERSYRIWIE